MSANAQLLDCAHVGAVRAVCQYEGCAKTLCDQCHVNCDRCGQTLCREHQMWREDRHRVFCPRDSRNYTMRKLARRLLAAGGIDVRPL